MSHGSHRGQLAPSTGSALDPFPSPPLLEEFLALRESQNTRAAYRRDVTEALFYLGNPREVTPEDLAAYFDSPHLRSLARSTQNRKRAVLRTYFAHLEERGQLDGPSPMRAIRDLKRTTNPSTRRFLVRREVRRLLAAVPDRRSTAGARDYAALAILVYTGLRVSELVEARLGDLSEASGRRWLTVRGKGGHVRKTPLPAPAWRALDAYLRKRPEATKRPEEPLLARVMGREPRPVDGAELRLSRGLLHHRIRRLAEAAGLEGVHPHTLRHTFAVSARRAGADLYALSRAMGHASISTTALYQHLIEDEEENAFDAVERFLKSTIKASRLFAASPSTTEDSRG